MPEQKQPTLIHPAAREEKTFGRNPVNNNNKKTANAEMQHVSLFISCMHNLDENKKYIYIIYIYDSSWLGNFSLHNMSIIFNSAFERKFNW